MNHYALHGHFVVPVPYYASESALYVIFIKSCKVVFEKYNGWHILSATVQTVCYILASRTLNDGEMPWRLSKSYDFEDMAGSVLDLKSEL